MSRKLRSAGFTPHKIRAESSSNVSEVAECWVHSAQNPRPDLMDFWTLPSGTVSPRLHCGFLTFWFTPIFLIFCFLAGRYVMSLRGYCGTRYRHYEWSPLTSNIVPVTVLPSSTLTRWSDSENLPLQVPGRPSKMSALSFATERVSPRENPCVPVSCGAALVVEVRCTFFLSTPGC